MAGFPTRQPLSRREMLARCGNGMGLLGLVSLLGEQGMLEGRALGASMMDRALNPLAPQAPMFKARAKSVIWVFVNGGPSHVDTWDYKPELVKKDGVELAGFDKNTGFFAGAVGPLMKPVFKFTPRGQCGKMVSEVFPNLGEHVDKMAFIHSGFTKSNNHSPALFMMNCGIARMGFPCVGSWVTYGLGSESKDLPGFVVMSDPLGRGLPKGSASNWGAAFLPGAYQGTWLKPSGDPIENLKPPAAVGAERQRAQLDFIKSMNESHAQTLAGEAELSARIESFELAYRMQSAAPDALDLSKEPRHVQELYGIEDKRCGHFARQCLTARRMVERGVRFVQIYSGGMENQRSWDGHSDIAGNHSQFAGETDKPVAALLSDLAQRGLLDETLVIWGGEFGRLPVAQKDPKPGRDHNPHCYTSWMAGGGVKGGVTYGESDEVGHKAAVNPVSVHDFHATILHLLGMDHKKLTYFYNGRRYRLTDVEGEVVRDILA
jgi:hypothetical protein